MRWSAIAVTMLLSARGVSAQEGPVTVASMPPVVVKTVPQAGDTQVDPGLTEIRATFSKDMMTKGMWAWVQVSKAHYPQTTGKPRYLDDKRTCVLPVKLEPGKTYVLWLNRGRFNTFRDAQNKPAVPYLLVFRTKGADAAKVTAKDALVATVERFAIDAPYAKGARKPGAPTDAVNEALQKLRDANRTDHLPFLIEYGLRVYLKNLTESRLARELPVKENLMLAELVRIAKIPKYTTAHEAGWLNRQFHAKFRGSGRSSYQVYLWMRERGFPVWSKWPNADRVNRLLKRIGATGMATIGGGDVCHYACR